MSSRTLEAVPWFTDRKARSNGEPGIYHLHIASLAAAVNHMRGNVDPAWPIRVSGFAFRSFRNEVLCPSATSIFGWASILPEAIEQAGCHCIYISRMLEEGDKIGLDVSSFATYHAGHHSVSS